MLSTHVDENGNMLTFNYPGTKLSSITDMKGQATTFIYDNMKRYLEQIENSSRPDVARGRFL